MRTKVTTAPDGVINIAIGVTPVIAINLCREDAATIARGIRDQLSGGDPETLQTQAERYGAKQVGADGIELTVGGSIVLTTKDCAIKLMEAIGRINGTDVWKTIAEVRRERDDARAQLAACGVIARGGEVKPEDFPRGKCDSVDAVIKLYREAEAAAKELRTLGVIICLGMSLSSKHKSTVANTINHILSHLPNYEKDKATGESLLAAVMRGRTFRMEKVSADTPEEVITALEELFKMFREEDDADKKSDRKQDAN